MMFESETEGGLNRWRWLPLLAALLVLAAAPAHCSRYGCPTRLQIRPCVCMEKSRGLDVSCEHAGAEQLREALASIAQTKQAIWYLKLRNNRMGSLPSQLLHGLDVRHLISHHSNLTSVDRDAFASVADRLESLDLAQNALERVPSDALEPLAALVSLNLNYNRLEILHAEAFKGLASLLRLSLYGNRIKFVDNLAFAGVGPNLTRLNLGANALAAVPSRPLRPLAALQRLQLQENRVSRLLPDEFEDGPQDLDVLDLARNAVARLPARPFAALRSLSSLDLEGNRIEQVDPRAFEGIEDSLEWLKLGENLLDDVPAHALRNLTRLRQLDLRGNNISRVRESDFWPYGKNLKFIYLQKNWLIYVDPSSLVALDSLEWLYLQSNNLTVAQYETYSPVLNTLQVLDIHDNPFHCDCKISWLRDWIQSKGASVLLLPRETKCHTPAEYSSLPLAEIPMSTLHCSSGALVREHQPHFRAVTLLQVFLLLVLLMDAS